MQRIDAQQLHRLMSMEKLVDVLDDAFRSPHEVPGRNKYKTSADGSGLIVMPAWGFKGYVGLKVLTATPANAGTGRPYLQGFYTLFDQSTGEPLAQIDAPTLTNFRTAAASALASRYLSKEDSSSLLMVGSGSLAPYLIRAHRAVRPIDRVYIWSRTHSNAVRLAEQTEGAEAVTNIRDVASDVDIISCATQSKAALVTGDMLLPGQHVDLVGGYTHDMRETDDAAVHRSAVYVDIEAALDEAGDLVHPLHHGTWRRNLLRGTLTGLCNGKVTGRTKQSADHLVQIGGVRAGGYCGGGLGLGTGWRVEGRV